METIEKDPTELGSDLGRWSTARLATYLREITAIELTGEQVRRILNKEKAVRPCAVARRIACRAPRESMLTFGLNLVLRTSKTRETEKYLNRS